MNAIQNLSFEEKQAIEELKKRTMHELTPRLREDDTLFYRFLKARDFNLKNAEAMLRKHFFDRKLYDIEEIGNGKYAPPEHMNTYLPTSKLEFDKEGSLIFYIDVGGADHKGLASLFSLRQLVQYCVSIMEKSCDILREQSKKLGKPITRLLIIMNLEKFDLYKATYKKSLEYLIEGFKLYQDNYPERIRLIYIINASFYFYMAFPIVKTVIASALLNKIHVFGKSEWKEALLKEIDGDVLPAFLGGNRTDPDGNPMCNSFILHGKPVPEELYLLKAKKTIAKENGVQKLIVSRFSSSEIVFYIYEPNTLIEWEFETKTRDIGFGLYFKDRSKQITKLEELIPKQRFDTAYSSETGLYKCEKPGKYIVVFDNSYSWIRTKEIYYRFRLVKPDQ